ncbi:Mut7-C ubiquitin/RNAse domain-containing protein [Streptomyces europaeiscabiei]|uniref:Mut7-C RNAse domain-containing protein n=1 Tax=Streptomyces TaxID=1883 RepID=UPI000A387A87|nr:MULTISPECIES: Mut7-C RNAse domain-containing protein [Streptomyces]MDX3588482.1 Mut7-C RNAse domain-containing protein [Streptomyces europaeiscabiei]MDX3619819.1 Mut7-C RNAse domain-containing protein [Streptomyces europaeiscabiei]MDX3637498.1 Mut7-C RNAse domain-containing protein [Streptomyces europaeiscabiei]MDX3655486.1 Mut7-C RNAse domain-containing protein [Streptomyces europaeiscabiei]WUD35148.1 Mut7-C ubiquitin/RNAse domain-containing protein [Streptomyces europaeiscabiei]
MKAAEIHVEVAPELALFVPHARREGSTPLATDGVSTLGHVIESLGVPLTEVGALVVNGREVPVSHIPADGESVTVRPVPRPQQVPGAPLRFLLDVHLGTLARRLRLLGVDAAYESTDIGDPALATRSAAEQRVMLSRDRGLLRRRELWAGAYIYSTQPEEQLRDVLDRFAPELRPWTRCTACNGLLKPATKEEVADRLEGGTQKSYDVFAQCEACGRAYWKGAHHEQLEAIVREALRMRTG